MQAIHAKKLEQALRSHERFPINLEWMVDVFKYKHISSLTTHLKRHFKMNVHYKRFAQEQNKRVWTYFISVECFIGICEYVRHAARKKIANVWLRKVGIKGGSRRTARDYEDDVPSCSEEDPEDEEEEMEDEEELEYDYFDEVQSPPKRRRIEDDEEYRYEEDDEDTEERAYFQEMEEEEACVEYDTDESADYESCSSAEDSSSYGSPSPNQYLPANTPTIHFRIIASSPSSSSDSLLSSSDSMSSAPSTPTSPSTAERIPLSTSVNIVPICPPAPASPAAVPRQNTPLIKPHIPECEIAPPTSEMSKEQVDWSYLHLRPNPLPMGSVCEAPAKHFASLMFGPQYYSYSQLQPYSYMFAQGSFLSNSLHLPSMLVDPNGFPLRTSRFDMDNLHGDLPSMEDRQFDTNMFLSFPEEHHFPYFTHDE